MPRKKGIDYASLYTLRKDGRYMYRWTDSAGRHCLYDKDPEKLWHKINDPKPEVVYTFADAVDEWERQHLEEISYKTAEAYAAPTRRLKEQYGARPVSDITAADVAAYLSVLGKKGFSRRSVQMHRDILNMVFNHAIVAGHIAANPCAAVSMPRNLPSHKRELPTDEAIQAVKNGADVPFGLFALVCLYAGLRRGEALALTYEDIDRDAGVIHVTKAVEFVGNNPHLKTPKTAAGYRDAILLDALAAVLPEDGTGLLFPRPDGGLLTKIQYRKRWAKYCEAIGHEITAHQLRHGFATILYEAGVPDKDAQELLGHSSITVTRDVYTHIRQSQRKDTASRLNQYIAEEDAAESDTNSDTKKPE